jgi:hypothetical protein
VLQVNRLQGVSDLSYVLSLVLSLPQISLELSNRLGEVISSDVVDIVHLELDVHLPFHHGIYPQYD